MAQEYSKYQPEGFRNSIEKVAIIGAGGRMGTHITEQLLKNGKHVVKVISRPNSTNKLPAGVEVVRINYNADDNSALVEALKGQQALIITMSVVAPRDTISKLVRAAAKAGVPYVLPNWYGHDPADKKMCDDVLLTKFREAITSEFAKSTGTSYFFLACGFWYEFSLGGGDDRYGFDIRNRSLILFDDGHAPITTSTWPQCGKAIAKLLSLKVLPEDERDRSTSLSQFRNKPVYIESFRLSQRDMFESIKRVTGTTDSDWSITYESSEERWKTARDALLTKGDSHAFVKMLYSRTFFPNGGGDLTPRGFANEVLGLEKEDLNESTAAAVAIAEADKPVIHRSADVYGDVFKGE